MTAIDVSDGSRALSMRITVPLVGLSVTVAMHMAVAVWWASGLTSRVSAAERVLGPSAGPDSLSAVLARLDERTQRMDRRENTMARRIERLEARGQGRMSAIVEGDEP